MKVFIVFSAKIHAKTKNTYIKNSGRITRLKKIPCGSIEFNIQDPHYTK